MKAILVMLLCLLGASCLSAATLFSDALVAFDMNESGGVLQDVSGNNHDSINGLGGATRASGLQGGALRFDGTDQVKIGDGPFRLQPAFSLEASFLIESFTGDWVRVVGKGQSNNRNYGLWYHPNGHWLFQISQSGSSSCCINAHLAPTTDHPLSLNTWHHMAGVYTGSQMQLYVNGTLVATNNVSVATKIDSEPLTIGGADFHDKHIGLIDNVAVYDFAVPGDDFNDHSQGVNFLASVAVPEPSSLLLLLGGGLAVFMIRFFRGVATVPGQ